MLEPVVTRRGETMTEEVKRWLEATAWPLKSLHAGASDDDLQPLHDVLTDVRVLGMGEATHGTAESFRLKHRLPRFLGRERGFTALAVEVSASGAHAVDDYAVNGTGNAAEALAGLGFRTWRTRELLAVVEWMREHNRTAPPERAVRFVGIDPQRCAASLAVLHGLLPGIAPERADILSGPVGTLADAKPGARAADGKQALDEARELLRFLEENRTGLAARGRRHGRPRTGPRTRGRRGGRRRGPPPARRHRPPCRLRLGGRTRGRASCAGARAGPGCCR
jgi:erythromycin esterase